MPLTELEEQICATIAKRETALLRDLERYVAIPTGGDHRPGLEKLRTLLTARLEKLGGRVEHHEGEHRPRWLDLPGRALWRPEPTFSTDDEQRDDPTDPAAITVVRGPSHEDASPRVLIASHLDTVHDPQGSFQTLERTEGDLAVGPGAADMKGGIVIALAALEALAEHDVPLRWSYLFNCDEETGSFGSAHVLREMAQAHDLGIATEPALPGGSLAIERMGSGSFKIEVIGRSAHVGRDFTSGVSAVNALAEVIIKLQKLAKPKQGRIVSVGPLVGGTVVNAVPDYAAAWGNVRFADAAAGEALGLAIDALATADDAMPRVIVHRQWNRPAKPKTPEVETLALRAREAAEDLGQTLPFASTGGVCDGNILQEAGLPTLDTLGVLGGNLHRTDEFVDLGTIAQRGQLLALLLARIAKLDVHE